jgi:predicted ArsR family transcriptional regulator
VTSQDETKIWRRWCYREQVTSDAAIQAVAALGDDLRRGLYEFIRAADGPVTREEAAAAVGISRKLAAFHLDKLVDAGLLQTSTRPGTRKVGRAPKVYRPAEQDLRISFPPRQPDLLADILLDAVLAEGQDARAAALRVARERGAELGEDERRRTRPGRLGTERALTMASALLTRCGFEPSREAPTRVRLRTCPFHPLAAKAPNMVCGINHALLAGLIDGLGATTIDAVLDPHAGECCVELQARDHPPE